MENREHSEEATIMSLRRDGGRVMGNIRDAQTVLSVANEAWSDQHESFIGVLDLLDHKLAMIESGTKSLLEKAGWAMVEKQSTLSSVDRCQDAEKRRSGPSGSTSPNREKL